MRKGALYTGLAVAVFVAIGAAQPAFARKPKQKEQPQKTKTAYEKIFDGKKTKTAEGLFKLHKIESEVYLEIPDSLMGAEMLLGATVMSVSDGNESSEGMQPSAPRQVVFRRTDSLLQIALVDSRYLVDGKDEGIKRAVEAGRQPSIMASFPILAVSPDSGSVIVKATSFFVSDNDFLSPKDPASYNSRSGFAVRSYKYKSAASYVRDVVAFGDNASVVSELSYDVSTYVFGISLKDAEPLSANIRISFMLLPEKARTVREADARVGTSASRYIEYCADKQGAAIRYFANRWRLEPSDGGTAFDPANPVEPVKPIVFYVDGNFPSAWKTHIENGILVWNDAFVSAGIKNAIRIGTAQADSLPDVNDLGYSAVRYIPSPARDIRHNVWTDPRTGEILSANIYISHNIAQQIQTERFLQTGAVDSRARTLTPDDELFGESLTRNVAHYTGLCLGLLANKGASQSVPVDSLRSPHYTNANGLSPSIMDRLPLNYVAQPEDFAAGVKLCQTSPGVYDYYALGWLYSDNQTVLDSLPYRFLREQSDKFSLDPRAAGNDLGDDAILSAEYGLKNLAVVMRSAPEWIDSEDYDYAYREEFPEHVYYYMNDLLKPVMLQLGGVYVNERYSGDALQYYECVSKADQKNALQWLLNLIDDLSWLDNRALVAGEGLNPEIAEFIRTDIFSNILRTTERIALSAALSEDPFTRVDALSDISSHLWSGCAPATEAIRQRLQTRFVDKLIELSGLGDSGRSKADPLYFDKSFSEVETAAIAPITGVSYLVWPEDTHLIYGVLLDCRTQILAAHARTSSRTMKDHYSMLAHRINNILNTK